MNKHYVCPVCGGVSSTPKNCGTEGCHAHGQPLVECHCTDGQHAGVVKSNG